MAAKVFLFTSLNVALIMSPNDPAEKYESTAILYAILSFTIEVPDSGSVAEATQSISSLKRTDTLGKSIII